MSGSTRYSRVSNPLLDNAFNLGDDHWITAKSLWRRITDRINLRYVTVLVALAFVTLTYTVTKLPSGSSIVPELPSDPDRPLIIYAFHETDNARENLEFFLRHGMHDGADWVFIINGESDVKFPAGDHISFRQRNNSCYDLGAYAEVLNADDGKLLKSYERFILINASVRGPFLPTWSRECWSDAYLGQLTDEVKLVGISMNCHPAVGQQHIQSMVLATDQPSLALILEKDLYCFENMEQAVRGEVGITKVILDAGFKVKAMMTAFSSDPDYTNTCTHGDVLFNGTYYDMSIHPYETMFQKANRNIYPEQLARLTEWHDKSGYSSQPACGRKKNM